jgi:hypothetical protein
MPSPPSYTYRDPILSLVLICRSSARIVQPWLAASAIYQDRAAPLSTFSRVR